MEAPITTPPIEFERTDNRARLPERMHEDDAGFDLPAHVPEGETIMVPEDRPVMIDTGLRARLPEGYELQVRSRSGLAAKYGIYVLNSPGTVDPSYRGEIKVVLARAKDPNIDSYGESTAHAFGVTHGDRIAQAVLKPVYEPAAMKEVESVDRTTERGTAGFNSTGT